MSFSLVSVIAIKGISIALDLSPLQFLHFLSSCLKIVCYMSIVLRKCNAKKRPGKL